MQAILNDWVELATILSVTTIIAMWINVARSRARRREQDLRSAGHALEAHYAAVSKLVDDPAFPLEAKAILVTLTEGISRREVAESLGSAIGDGSIFKRPVGRPDFTDELVGLYRTRKDLAEAYQTAVMSGLAALFLRWPGNASLFQKMTVEISTDVRKEGAVAGKLVEITKKLFDKDHNGNGGMIGPPDRTVAC